MNKNPIHLLLTVVTMLVMILGCGVRPPDEQKAAEEAAKWVPAKDLTVNRQENQVQRKTLIMVDLSASNTSKPAMWEEVKAQVAEVGELDEVCVLQISEDSSATPSQPWCRGILDPWVCSHDPIKEGNWSSVTRQKREYAAAGTRVEGEMKQCESERLAEKARRAVQGQTSLEAWINATRNTQKTDIQGAFARSMEMKSAAVTVMDIWVYSDMEDDPLVKRSEPLTLSLAGQNVHVRRLARSGGGYDSTWQTMWTTIFTGWDNPVVDWKNFRQGEFGEAKQVTAPAAPKEPVIRTLGPMQPPPAQDSPIDGLFHDK